MTEKKVAINKNYDMTAPKQMVEMSKVLKKHIIDQNLAVNIMGKNYIQVEGWQFAGGLMGMAAKIVKIENLSSDKEKKWRADVEIVKLNDNQSIGYGMAICSNLEAKKKSFDEYAICSMAQTRAIGKAYRNMIGWVMKLAGYESTPSEEMMKVDQTKPTKTPTEKPPIKKVDYISQVKIKLGKMGAKTEVQAIKLLKEKTGLAWKDFKVTQRQAQMALAVLLNLNK